MVDVARYLGKWFRSSPVVLPEVGNLNGPAMSFKTVEPGATPSSTLRGGRRAGGVRGEKRGGEGGTETGEETEERTGGERIRVCRGAER